MPNLPLMVGEGMTLLCFDNNIDEEERKVVRSLFEGAGLVEELEERLMSEVTALTSSSPAYIFMMIEAMADGAVQSGIPRKIAYKLAAQAVLGSAKMVLETGLHPAELKDQVCSPAGTTIEAVQTLEKYGFRYAVQKAMKKCTERALEIGRASEGK
jgi:pyrroline-5-carboxylate reductase